MKSRYRHIGFFAVIGSLSGAILGILWNPDSAALWAGVGTALGAGVGLLFLSLRQAETSNSGCGPCRTTKENKDNERD